MTKQTLKQIAVSSALLGLMLSTADSPAQDRLPVRGVIVGSYSDSRGGPTGEYAEAHSFIAFP